MVIEIIGAFVQECRVDAVRSLLSGHVVVKNCWIAAMVSAGALRCGQCPVAWSVTRRLPAR